MFRLKLKTTRSNLRLFDKSILTPLNIHETKQPDLPYLFDGQKLRWPGRSKWLSITIGIQGVLISRQRRGRQNRNCRNRIGILADKADMESLQSIALSSLNYMEYLPLSDSFLFLQKTGPKQLLKQTTSLLFWQSCQTEMLKRNGIDSSSWNPMDTFPLQTFTHNNSKITVR